MDKILNNSKHSPHVLDLSKKREKKKEPSALPLSKKRRLAPGKIIAAIVLVFFLGAGNFGISIYKKIKEVKSGTLSASATSEKNMAALGELLEIIKYLPNTKETKKIKELAANFEEFKNIMGFDRSKKYLLLFQNSDESRATGGFIGSVGILNIGGGKIQSIKLNDVYNIDGQLAGNIEPPKPIKKISAAWSLHDSNWFFDFPTTAEKSGWIYERAGGETMDGVIAVNPRVAMDILKVMGPVKVSGYGVELDENNFIEITQQQVENEYNKTVNQPKLFLADFLKQLKGNLDALPMHKKISIAKIFIANLDQKNIQVNFSDPASQNFIEKQNWGGKVNDSEKDYLAIVHSNINGFKTDAIIEETATVTSEIAEDGTTVNTLTITREHKGDADSADWYKRVNTDYLRIYVPKGSELIEASGMTPDDGTLKDPAIDYSDFVKDNLVSEIEKNKTVDGGSGVEIAEESGKTVFGAWVYVSMGEKALITYKYRLPFRVNFSAPQSTGAYSLLFQKQSGMKLEKINYDILYPADWKIIGHTDDFDFQNGKASKIIDASGDRFSGIVFGR